MRSVFTCVILVLAVIGAQGLRGGRREEPLDSAGGAVGGAGDAAGGAATGGVTAGGDAVGGAVGGVGSAVGVTPPPAGADGNIKEPIAQVPVLGSAVGAEHAVTTSMQCVVSLTIQFFVVYTALALCRTAADSLGWSYEGMPLAKVLKTACLTVAYAPMLALLFLGCRMRVNWLTQGKGNPPAWVQMWMYACTYSVLAMTIIVCVIPLFTGDAVTVDPKTGDIDPDTKPFTNWIAAGVFTVIQYIIMIGLYVGVVCVMYGIWTFTPPEGSWPGGEIPPVSPAVACVMILTAQYFLCFAGAQFARTFTQLSGWKTSRIENALIAATTTMGFAPMLGVLFIGARMRALQMDPINGKPQTWAQNCFYMCTYALLAQCLLTILIPLVMQGEAETGKTEGDVVYKVENAILGTILTVARFVIMFCIYVGFTCVIWSVLTIQHPRGDQYTPPISVTMQCVINLTIQFFIIYLVIWVCITIDDFLSWKFNALVQTMENAKLTVGYCPMLAILFVGTRMRALMLTNNRGAPQGYAQDGMYMATWSLLIQFAMVLITPFAAGEPQSCDEDGNIKWAPENPILFYVVSAIRWIGYIFLYGGIIAVIVGVYTMTPETANGRGSVPLIGDGEVPGVGVKTPGYEGVGEPYGANDLPGVPGF